MSDSIDSHTSSDEGTSKKFLMRERLIATIVPSSWATPQRRKVPPRSTASKDTMRLPWCRNVEVERRDIRQRNGYFRRRDVLNERRAANARRHDQIEIAAAMNDDILERVDEEVRLAKFVREG